MNERKEFRGKRKDNGKWVCGYYFYDDTRGIGACYIKCRVNFIDYEVIPDTIGQHTGIVLGAGVEIYEGDYFDYNENYYAVVEWVYSGWQLVAYKKPIATCSGDLNGMNLGYIEDFDLNDYKCLGSLRY